MLTEEQKQANSAEASVIGSMLIEPRCVPELMQELTALEGLRSNPEPSPSV